MATTVFDLQAVLGLDTSKYESGLKGALNTASTATGKIGSGLATAAKVGLAAVGAATTAVAGFATTAVKSGLDFDSAMSQVAATMGKTMQEMDNEVGKATISANGKIIQFEGTLRDFAMELGRNTAFTATEAAEALNYMALAGYDAQMSMDMLPTVLNLAAAGNFDLARASDMVTDTQTAFGMSAERTALMVDEMAKAASTGNTSVEQLGEAYLRIGGLAQELNGGFIQTKSGAMLAVDGVQELSIAYTAMANAGIKGSEAGTHMRNMLLKLSKPTKDGAADLETMKVKIFDASGQMRSLSDIFTDLNEEMSKMTQEEKIKTISNLFNTRDLASAESLLGAVEGKVVKLGDEVLSLGSAYEKYGDDIYDTTKGFEIVQSSWDQIGESVLNAKVSLEDSSKALKKSGVDWKQYGITTTKDVEKMAGDIRYMLVTENKSIEDSAKEIATAYDMSFTDAFKAVTSVDKEVQKSIGSSAQMAQTQLDNLKGSITYFKSALEGAKLVVSDQLSPALREFVDFGTESLTKMADGFKEGGLEGAMQAFGEILSDGLAMITKSLPEFVKAGVELLKALGQGIMDNADLIIGAMSDVLDILINTIGDNLPAILDAINTITQKLLSALSDHLPEITPIITDFIVGMAQIIADNAEEFVEVVIAIAGAIGEGIVQAAPILAEKAPDIINALVDGVKEHPEALIALAPFMLNKISGAIGPALSILGTIGKKIVGPLASHIGSGISNAVTSAGPYISSAMSSLGSSLSSAMSSIGSFATADMGATMASGGAAAVGTAATAILGSVVAFFGGAEIGKTIGEYIFPDDAELYEQYSGITGTLDMLKDFCIALKDFFVMTWEDASKAVSEWWGSVKNFFSEGWEAVKKSVSDNWNAIKTTFTTTLTNIATSIASFWLDIVKKFTDAWNNLKNIVSNGLNSVKNFFTQAWTNIKQGVSDAWNKITDTLKSSFENIKKGFTDLVDNLKNLPSKALEWGKDLIKNFTDGIKQKWEDLKEGVKGVANTVKEFLGFSEPEEGPLSNFHTFAPDMMELYAKGIRDNIDLVESAASEAANAIGNGLSVSDAGAYQISSAGVAEDKLTAILEMLEAYMPTYATADDMDNFGVSLNGREFGRLVREVG